jgi:alpha-L-fucosidase
MSYHFKPRINLAAIVLAAITASVFAATTGPIALTSSAAHGAEAEPSQPAKIRIVLAGDSTVTDKAGWGVGFAKSLDDAIECVNLSRGGRSSKSFINEGLWKKCLEAKPDYVLIQFGHNDQPGKGLDRETDLPTYRGFMTQYVDEARAVGAKPVLVTSLGRRQWGKDDNKIRSSLQPYVDVVKEIAVEKKVPLIELHAKSIELYEILGKEGCNELSPMKDNADKTGKEIDNTHLNAKGSEVIGTLVAALLADAVPELAPHIKTGNSAADSSSSTGPFQPTWESLKAGYKCPDWFRDAKFGIWAHWTAQCVPEEGDWYARFMYMQGEKDNKYHLEHFGHPTEFGFKDIDNLWHAENWEPEKLMELYKAAGAKYFVALANHHDNFDCFDSKYHEWNSVRVGPHKDIVGTWEKVARAAGLRFGVSNHSAHAWHWFQVAYGYDAEGPLAGKRYDGFLTKADGVGKWWEGLDPQELYTGESIVMPEGITTIKEAKAWYDKHTGEWLETPPPNNPHFVDTWLLRCNDLVDKYHPDLMYFDNTELPLGQAGLDAVAHYYNSNIEFNHGKLDAVLTAKKIKPEHEGAVVEDYERGASDKIQPLPWQTCSCIGQWHYARHVQYKTVAEVARMLVDIVSKNGNLLLSIPVRGDGTIDDREVDFLHGLAKWMDVGGEGIFASRPWKVFGEGPTNIHGGMFSEGKVKYTPQDLRFTTKDGALFVYVMATPTEAITVKSLATGAENSQPVADVKLLGSDEALHWTQSADGLVIDKPAAFPTQDVVAFKVAFK